MLHAVGTLCRECYVQRKYRVMTYYGTDYNAAAVVQVSARCWRTLHDTTALYSLVKDCSWQILVPRRVLH